MKKMNIMMLSVLFVMGQGYAQKPSQQEKDTWKTDISRMLTDSCINDKGQIIDNNVINSLIDYNWNIVTKKATENQDAAAQAILWLDSFFMDRLKELRVTKGLPFTHNANQKIAFASIPQERVDKLTTDIETILSSNWDNIKGIIRGEKSGSSVIFTYYLDTVSAATEPENKVKVTNMIADIAKNKQLKNGKK